MLTTALLLTLAAKSEPAYLAVNGLLIGTYQSGWHKVDHLKNHRAKLSFTEVGIGRPTGSWSCDGMEQQEPNNEMYVASQGDAPRGVIFSGHVRFPRPVKVLSNSNPVYVSALKSYLHGHGVTSTARLTQVLSVDLDGDGTQEILLEGSNRDDLLQDMHDSKRGDYSIVLLRYVRGGKVVDKPLLFDHGKNGDMNFMDKIIAIGDFDGDGTMDVVVTTSYYEGSAAQLLRFKGGHVTKLAENGDGV